MILTFLIILDILSPCSNGVTFPLGLQSMILVAFALALRRILARKMSGFLRRRRVIESTRTCTPSYINADLALKEMFINTSVRSECVTLRYATLSISFLISCKYFQLYFPSK